MTARAIIAPLSFGDTSLPRINLTYVRPIAGAAYDWAVNQLPAGSVTQWPSLIDGTALVADGTAPTVSGEGKARTIRFDGTSSRMRVALSSAGAETIVAVYRFVTPKALDTVYYGLLAASGSLGSGADGRMRAVSGTAAALYPSPDVKIDANWHVSIVTLNGASSAVSLDGIERAGNLPIGTRDGVTLGFSGATGNRAAIEYKRVAIIPGGMTTTQRAAITEQMRADYL